MALTQSLKKLFRFSKTVSNIQNQKNSSPPIYDINLTNTSQLYNLVYGSDCSYSVTFLEAYKYFAKISPLRTAVGMIADAIADLPLITESTKQEMTTEHNLIKIINNPGIGIDRANLLKELTVSCLLTNESWLLFRGRINAEPININYIRPYNIDIYSNLDYDGYPYSIKTNSPKDKRTYYKHIIDGHIRYVDSERNPNVALNELIPIIGITDIHDQFRGLSPLTSIKKELDHLWHGNVHNAALLKNGMRLSAILSPKVEMTDQQYNQVEDSVGDLFTGSEKAGGVFISPVQLESVNLMMKNTDADYMNLIAKAEQRVYAAYEIPLPLVTPDTMTLSNYEAAQFAFYDQTVSDATTKLFPAIAKAFAIRSGEENLKLTFNPHGVKALQQRQAERMETLRKTYALGTKEIRETAGYGDPNTDDPIFAPATLVPLTIDASPNFEIDEDEGEDG